MRQAEAQAEAGPLMRMVRRANMELSIAGGGLNRKAPLAHCPKPVADSSEDTNLLIIGEKSMSVIRLATTHEEVELHADGEDAAERLFAALGRYTTAELLELLYVGEQPGFFEHMRMLYNIKDDREQLSKQAIKSNSAQSLAETYERLKDLRRRGELLELDALQSETLQPGIPTEFGATDEMWTASTNAPADPPEKIGKVLGSSIRFLEISTLASRIFGDKNKAEAWLNKPNASFSEQRPIDLLQDELGTAVVREALEQIDHGIFA